MNIKKISALTIVVCAIWAFLFGFLNDCDTKFVCIRCLFYVLVVLMIVYTLWLFMKYLFMQICCLIRFCINKVKWLKEVSVKLSGNFQNFLSNYIRKSTHKHEDGKKIKIYPIDKTKFKTEKIRIIYYVLLGLFLVALYVAFSELIHAWIIKIIAPLYSIIQINLSTHRFSSIILGLVVVGCACMYIWERRSDKLCSLGRFLTFVICLVVCVDWQICNSTYIIGKISFYCLLVGIFSICAFFEFYKMLPKTILKRHEVKKGFTTDCISGEDIKINEVRRLYANKAFEKLCRTNVQKESYALAVVGKWGAGKSTFVNLMKQQAIAEKYECIEFNPWLSLSAENVVLAFVDVLKTKLHATSMSLFKLLVLYSKAISTVKSKWQIVPAIVEPFFISKDTTEDLKQKICDKLKLLQKPIFIFIDDTDRMHVDEITEIFRLIRNTFNFPNLIYIVTLDKEHVCEQMKLVGVKDGALFLEKIFPAEVSLPTIDSIDIILTLADEIKKMVYPSNIIQSIFDRFTNDEREILARILKTYRGAKHFARQFAVAYEVAYQNLNREDICYKDLFLLELLKHIDNETYNQLSYSPDDVLTISETCRYISAYYYYSAETEKIDVSKNFKSSDVIYLLKQLFPQKEPTRNRISSCCSYSQYFCLGLKQLNLSQESFDKLLSSSWKETSPVGIYHCMREWVCRPIRISSNSLYELFYNYNLDWASEKQVLSYVYAFVCWMEFETNNNLLNCLQRVLSPLTYKKKTLHTKVKNEFLKRCKEMLNRTPNTLTMATLFAKLFSKNPALTDCLLSKANIEDLLLENFRRVLDKRTWEPISIIKEDGNILNAVAINSCFYYSEVDSTRKVYRNSLTNFIIAYFKHPEHQGAHFDEAVKALRLPSDYTQGASLQDVYAVPDQVTTKSVERIFGSDNLKIDFLQDFLDHCFVEYKEK